MPLILRKIFENMAAEKGRLTLKVGEFTCMHNTQKYIRKRSPQVLCAQFSNNKIC
jgi:hypothetical protein